MEFQHLNPGAVYKGDTSSQAHFWRNPRKRKPTEQCNLTCIRCKWSCYLIRLEI